MASADDTHDMDLVDLLDESLIELQTRGTIDLEQWRTRHPRATDDWLELLETLQDLQTAVTDWQMEKQDTVTEQLLSSPDAVPPDSPAETNEPLPEHIGR
jgi:hypothetical protein